MGGHEPAGETIGETIATNNDKNANKNKILDNFKIPTPERKPAKRMLLGDLGH